MMGRGTQNTTIWTVCVCLLASCSRDEEVQPTINETAAEPDLQEVAVVPPQRSFDPRLQHGALERAIEQTAKEKAEQAEKEIADANVELPKVPADTAGREQAVAIDILAMPEGDARSLALTELMRRWVEKDPEAAWEFHQQVADSIPLKRAFYRGIMPYMARHNPELVLETVEAGNWWPDQWIPAREASLRVSEVDLQRAVDYFVDVEQGKQHKEVAYRFASRLSDEGGSQSALAFAAELEKPLARAYATRAAVTSWVEEDSVAASSYVNEIAEPEVRDHAILGLTDAIWITNPRDSATWAQSMTDADLRTETMIRLASAWDRRGEAANVDALLNAPGLSASEAQAVRDALAEAAADP